MKKKWIISIGAIMAIVTLIVILSFTLFSLKSIEVDFRTSQENITFSEDEIINSSKIKKGGSVFFRNKQDYKKNIEKLSPYIKVVNIETAFPNKMIIHIAERQEVYALQAGESLYYICDEEMKVLRTSTEADDAIILQVSGLSNYKEGDKIELQHKANLYSALCENNRTLGMQKAMIENIELLKQYDEVLKKDFDCTKVTFRNGQTYIIKNDSYGMVYKADMMLDIFSQYHNFVGKSAMVVKNGISQTITLTENDLKNATFVISNYYDYTTYSEKDCYFTIYIEEEIENN